MVKKLYTDDVQLVTNIGGNHHLLRFSINKAPIIYIYDARLQLKAEETIDVKLKDNIELRVLPFRDYYYLYLHTMRTSRHQLFRIDGEGMVTSLSVAFQQVVDTALNKSTSTLQLINRDEKLIVTAHTYYDAIKKIGTSIVELNKESILVRQQKVFFSFNSEEDLLQQTMLAGNNLLLLKTSADEEKGNSLDVIKIDLATEQSRAYSYNTASHISTAPAVSFNKKDSSILVYTMLREPIGSQRRQVTGFINFLNDSLQELMPVAILPSRLWTNLSANYFLLQRHSLWVNLSSNFIRVRRQETLPGQNYYADDYQPAYSTGTRMPASVTYTLDYNGQSRIKFTVFNDELQAAKDTLISVKKYEYGIQARPFAQVSLNNKGCLFLIQNFTEKKRGLVMLSAEKTGRLAITELNVYDKYEYVLDQLQAVGKQSVILPYIHKNEAGLVKISFD